ncbi:MAG: peptidylprolyl isomerase [Deltaproteobacteria bacterium]|nr:peptidylprolyl isomerase [Deltaproteobacteria bacterium]MBI3293719.1 peptidylprolyl isomerase [Deltaproteobacteria bacterium]
MLRSQPLFNKIIFGGALCLGLSLSARNLVDRTVVTVNDEVVLESDVAEFHRKTQSKSFQELFGGINPEVLKDPQKTLQLLVEEKIIDQQVKKLELKANDQEVDGQIRAILKRNSITTAQLGERLKQLGATLPDYREGIRRQLERKNLIDREIRPTLEVSDEQVRHFYLRTSQSAKAEKEYKLAHILLDASKKDAKNPDVRAKEIYAQLQKDPVQFDALAKQYSTDSSTAQTGGVIGYFSPSSMAKEFREVIPKIEVGHVAPPIKTSAGVHLVKVIEARASDFSTLSKERKDGIRAQLLEQEMDRKMQLWLERKKAESYIKLSGEKNDS